MNKECFLEIFRDVLDIYNENIIQKYENDIAKAYVNVCNLPNSIFESNLEDCIENRSKLMRVFADSIQIKYLYEQFAEVLAEELRQTGFIEE